MFIRWKTRRLALGVAVDAVLVKSTRGPGGPRLQIVRHLGTLTRTHEAAEGLSDAGYRELEIAIRQEEKYGLGNWVSLKQHCRLYRLRHLGGYDTATAFLTRAIKRLVEIKLPPEEIERAHRHPLRLRPRVCRA